ncbi:MAG TPA: hypothetical protein ENJ55_01285 [Rhizobiales bacterium]|nr:hypothetical protein [Hyphomicrobiales bacterium]
MMQSAVLITMISLTLAACTQNRARVVSSPYSNGVLHSEPVFYNGKNYKMDFRFQASQNAYDVKVSGKGGRRIGGKPGDGKIVSNMVSSAIRHFACARGQKAVVLPGTARNQNGTWRMQARCA